MKKRTALEIKKNILRILKEHGEISLRELDIKVNTNSQTIRTQIEELEFFSKVSIIKHEKNNKNGRPYTTVKLRDAFDK